MTASEYTATKQCFACGSISGVGEAAVWIGNTFIFGKSLTDTNDRLPFTIPLAKGNRLVTLVPSGGAILYYIFSSN